ncbi:hypothetical protein LZP46_07495 [Acinetobacter sp. SCLZS86]|uniref:hypothetical protein n=1 Tax=unclassified Acinetobacter TaxID=196816 RepID=UPI0015BDAD77|nr:MULTISPECIES: hypothetical protein [unclassified Acinetobacter]NWK52148.1 hypothetical protein [Acinetobacter sp. SwsAc5]UIZ56274.1 hypothetical protein LZP46_07495 [Acinetobacter sp. SCLZS86]
MVAPIPKTKATELLEELSRFDELHLVMSEFRKNKYLIDIRKLLETNVDVAQLWICKGFVHSRAGEPKEMYDAFQNAQKLGAIDPDSMFNQATQYVLYGLFDEAIRAISLTKNTIAQEQLERIALSTFAYDKIEKQELMAETREKLQIRKNRLNDLSIDINQAAQFVDIFFNFLREQNIRFGLVRHTIFDDEEYYLHFEAVADLELTQDILNKFDQYIAEHPEFYDINSKINIILTPVSSIWHNFAA